LSLILISCCICSATDEYKNVIHQFVELNEAMGKSKDDVGLLIAQVKGVLESQKKSNDVFFRALATQCVSDVAKVDAQIKSNSDAVRDANNNLNNWKNNLESSTKDRKDARVEIGKAAGQLDTLRKRVAKLTMDYRVFAAEADKKLNVVKVLRDIISDELYSKQPGAFVQVNKFQQKLSELKEMLNTNSDSLYSPIISVLLDLATERNFADQGILKKILDNLRNLDKALKDFRAKQEKSLDAEMVNLRKQVKNVKQRIRAYRRMSHQAASKELDARHYIVFFTNEIQHFTSEKNRMEEAKRYLAKLCEFQKKVHKKSTTSLKLSSKHIVQYLATQNLKLQTNK